MRWGQLEKMKTEMTHKERILAAIEHRAIDRVPIDYWGTPEATSKLMKGLNVKDFTSLINILDLDKIINIQPEYIGPGSKDGIKIVDFLGLSSDKLTDMYVFDHWGVKYKRVKSGKDNFCYYEMCSHPIEKLKSIDEIEENYCWPKIEWFDFSKIQENCLKYPDYAIESGYIAPFYMYNNIRGLEKSLMDLAINEEMAQYIIQKISDYFYGYAKKIFEAGNGKIDIAQVTDDFGTQNGLMLSIEMFDRYFREQYRRLIKLVNSYNIKIFHHDDGSIMDLIPELVEVGIDILNPIQWHLPGMDINKLKKDFGDDICFHGGVDNQKVLPFGNTSDVEQEVVDCIEALANNKTGYILAPCHNIQVNTPVENILKMYEAAKVYGKF